MVIYHINPDDGDGGDLQKLVFNPTFTQLIAQEDFNF
jgi:hypothetical protein